MAMKVDDTVEHRKLLAEFKGQLIHHPRFEEVKDETAAQLLRGPQGRILMLVGPTGVGKTRLLHHLDEVLTAYGKRPDTPFSPPLVLEATSPHTGEFAWKDFYTRALLGLNEPAISEKTNLEEMLSALKQGQSHANYRHLTIPELRRQLEVAIRTHKPISMVVDEAQHFGRVRDASQRRNNLDVLKGLCNVTTTTMLLCGDLELKALMFQGGQLSRRIEVVHFQRYKYTAGDIKAFRRVLATIFQHAPLPLAVSVDRLDIEYYMRYSLGLVGILVDWFERAFDLAFRKGCRTLSKEHLDAKRLSPPQLHAIGTELSGFEAFCEAGDPAQIWDLLQIPRRPKRFTDDGNNNNDASQATVHKLKPGERAATRDPVGV